MIKRANMQIFNMAVLAILAAFCPMSVRAQTVWNGTSGDWSDGAKWSLGVPTNGGTATIGSGSVLLTNASEALAGFTMNGGTLTFSNWTTQLSATSLTINSSATLTLPSAFTNDQMSNRVWLACSNLTLASGASINVTGRGYSSPAATANGYGPGGGIGSANYSSGAGHGGRGGKANLGVSAINGGPTYGALAQPDAPGSGGGSGGASSAGGAGGGIVRIQADGQVTVSGSITANGNAGTGVGGGGGSGGSVWISCNIFAGTNGSIEVKGGDGNTPINAGGGGGGRIAIIYQAAQSGASIPTVQFSARPGNGATHVINPQSADLGTLYFPDNLLFNPTWLPHIGRWIPGSVVSLGFDTLVVSNGWIRLPGEGLNLTVTNNLRITSGGILDIGGDSYSSNINTRGLYYYDGLTSGPIVNIGGSLFITNASSFILYSGLTNGADYGALLSVTGNVFISNSTNILASHPVSGGSVLFRMSNLTVTAGGNLNADGRGYRGGTTNLYSSLGPGRGSGAPYAAGAGHGGRGGNANPSTGVGQGGIPYGSLTNPLSAGSGGGSDNNNYIYGASWGGHGGGLIRIVALANVTVDGTITADGSSGSGNGGYYGGGGSGGSVSISCNTFSGSGGTVSARGGNAVTPTYAGGGGGGRITVNYNTVAQSALPRPTVQFFVTPGKGYVMPINRQDADLGTLYFPDNQFFDPAWLPHIGRWLVPNFTNLTVTNLTVSNGWLRLPGEGFRLNVTNNLTITGTNSFTSATLDIGGDNYATNANSRNMWYREGLTSGPRLSISGNLVLTNGGRLYVHSGQTNAGGPSYGAEVIVEGAMQVVSNAWVYPFSHPTNGASVLFQIGSNLFISSNAGFNADGAGFAGGSGTNYLPGSGPGGGGGAAYSGGGGYGGAGGTNHPNYPGGYGGISYGSSNVTAHAGSGGGSSGDPANYLYGNDWGGHGGGFVFILARSGTLTLNGTITANGLVSGYYGGGGAGGGVMIEAKSFAGNGALTANGGAAYSPTYSGGGGGGRIAVWYGDVSDLLRQQILAGNLTHVASELAPETFTGSATANGADGYGDGTNGTVRYLQLYFPSGTIIRIF